MHTHFSTRYSVIDLVLVDLIPIILESNDNWWPKDLARLSRVSSAWTGLVRRRLYNCPRLCSLPACSLLARTLAENAFLLALLRGIELRPVVDDGKWGALRGEDMASLRYILSRPSLHSVTLGGFLAVRAERFLRSLTNADAVTYLHVDGSTLRSNCCQPASLEWDEGIACRFSSLKTLKLSNLELDIIYPSLPYSILEVAHLILEHIDIVGGYLHQLLHQSWSSLQTLFVSTRDASDLAEHLGLMLQLCSPTLRVLHYDICDSTATGYSVFNADPPSYASLQELQLDGVDIDSETLFIVGQRCQSLQKLSIVGRNVRVTPQQWASFVASGALPSLLLLTTPWGTNVPPFIPWSPSTSQPVLEALDLRKVHLQCPKVSSSSHVRIDWSNCNLVALHRSGLVVLLPCCSPYDTCIRVAVYI